MRLVAPAAAALLIAIVAPAAQAGARIKKLPSCEHAYLFPFSESTPEADFRDGLLCLINAVRKSQHLPALKGNAKLESVAQAQSDKFQRTGSGSHGKTLAEIGKRFEKKGYKPVVKPMPMSRKRGFVTTAAHEFGLKRGAKQPSNDYSKALSCPHKVPAPLLTAPPIDGADPLPTAAGDTVRAGLRCIGKLDCEISAELTPGHAMATSRLAGSVSIPAGQSVTLSFTFDPAAIQSELSAAQPSVTLRFTVAKPSKYSDVLNGPLQAG